MATHSSVLGWIILRTEEPGGLQSMQSQRHDWSDLAAAAAPFSPLSKPWSGSFYYCLLHWAVWKNESPESFEYYSCGPQIFWALVIDPFISKLNLQLLSSWTLLWMLMEFLKWFYIKLGLWVECYIEFKLSWPS